MKDSDPSHPKVLYTVYYPPHVLPKMMGSISLKLLASRLKRYTVNCFGYYIEWVIYPERRFRMVRV